ncbi:MAG TPA: septation protein SpoVG family protein [bacterium]|nr:septation protein SpoVG family protein [bacterium]
MTNDNDEIYKKLKFLFNIRIKLIKNKNNNSDYIKRAKVLLKISDYVIKGIEIIEGPKGLFVSMPQRADEFGEYQNMFHPITSIGRLALNDRILDEYQKTINKCKTQ